MPETFMKADLIRDKAAQPVEISDEEFQKRYGSSAAPAAAPVVRMGIKGKGVDEVPAELTDEQFNKRYPGAGQKSGFWGRIGENVTGVAGLLKQDPIQTIKHLATPDPGVAKEAADAFNRGDYGRYALSQAEAIPIVGPAIRRTEQDVRNEDWGAIGGDVATGLVTRGLARTPGAIARKAGPMAGVANKFIKKGLREIPGIGDALATGYEYLAGSPAAAKTPSGPAPRRVGPPPLQGSNAPKVPPRQTAAPPPIEWPERPPAEQPVTAPPPAVVWGDKPDVPAPRRTAAPGLRWNEQPQPEAQTPAPGLRWNEQPEPPPPRPRTAPPPLQGGNAHPEAQTPQPRRRGPELKVKWNPPAEAEAEAAATPPATPPAAAATPPAQPSVNTAPPPRPGSKPSKKAVQKAKEDVAEAVMGDKKGGTIPSTTTESAAAEGLATKTVNSWNKNVAGKSHMGGEKVYPKLTMDQFKKMSKKLQQEILDTIEELRDVEPPKKLAAGGVVAPQKSRVRRSKRGVLYGPPKELRRMGAR